MDNLEYKISKDFKEIINRNTGEVIATSSRYLIFQYSRSGMPVFRSNKQKCPRYFTQHVSDALWFYEEKYAKEHALKLKYGDLKIVTLEKALLLEQEGEPAPINWDYIPSFRRDED